MNHYEKLSILKQLTDNIGSIYGTEDFSVYFYSVIKMMRPDTILELGTGVGSTMLWAALALEENKSGKIFTIDNGSEWERLGEVSDRFRTYYNEDYEKYIRNLINTFEFEDQVVFLNQDIEAIEAENIDILFSDFAHSAFDVSRLMAEYTTKMSPCSRIYIDSASTNYSSYSVLEKIVGLFNSGKVPLTLLEMCEDPDALQKRVSQSYFELDHIIENKNRSQNSTACIKIQPVDIFLHPRLDIRI